MALHLHGESWCISRLGSVNGWSWANRHWYWYRRRGMQRRLLTIGMVQVLKLSHSSGRLLWMLSVVVGAEFWVMWDVRKVSQSPKV